MNRPLLLLSAPVAALLFGSGCTIANDYRIDDGIRSERSYRSVAGAVHIGRGAAIHRAKTVAGEITVDDGASTRSLSTVAGKIAIGKNASIAGDISTVAGGIRIGANTHVTGQVSTIAGSIDLNACRIDGAVRLTNGSLDTTGATRLPGGIHVRPADRDDNHGPTRIDIGADADVASIEVEPKSDVDLRISRQARVGRVTGATATYY